MYQQLSDSVVMKDGTVATKKVETLKAGDAGVDQTVAKMKRLSVRDSKNPEMIRIAKSLKGKTDVETAQNIFKYVVKNWKYVSDPEDSEFVTAPIHIVTDNTPFEYIDCDDYAALLTALLLASGEGFKVRYKVIAWRKHEYTHVYIECYIPSLKAYVPMDAVLKNKGFGNERPKIIRKKYYNVTSADALNDNEDVNIDVEEFGKQSLLRLIRGESDINTEARKLVQEVCTQGVKQKIKNNAGTITLAAIGGSALMFTAGYYAKKKNWL